MSVNTKYIIKYTDGENWRFILSIIPSHSSDGTLAEELLDRRCVLSLDGFDAGFEKWTLGTPKIPSGKVSFIFDMLPEYLRERMLSPFASRSIILTSAAIPPDGTQTTFYEPAIELSNLFIFTTDKGDSSLAEEDFHDYFEGVQTPAPEDVFKKDSAGDVIITVELQDVKASAFKQIATENFLDQQAYYNAIGTGRYAIYDEVIQTAYSVNGVTVTHRIGRNSANPVQKFFFIPEIDLLRAMRDAWEAVMRCFYRDQAKSFTFSGETFEWNGYRRIFNFTAADHVNDTEFISGINTVNKELWIIVATFGKEFDVLKPPFAWISGVLSGGSGSFVEAGYTNAWEILNWLAVNNYSKVQLKSDSVEFSPPLAKTYATDDPAPVFIGNPEVRRGAYIVAGGEAIVQDGADDDLSSVISKNPSATNSQEIPPVQVLFHNMPLIPALEDVQVKYWNGFFDVYSSAANLRGLFFMQDVLGIGMRPVRAYSHVNFADGVVPSSVAVPESWSYPSLTANQFGHIHSEFGKNKTPFNDLFWKPLRAAYLAQQRSSCVPYTLAYAIWKTFGNFLQATTKGDVFKNYAGPGDVGENYTVDASDVHPSLSVIRQQAVLLNVSVSAGQSSCEFLHRG